MSLPWENIELDCTFLKSEDEVMETIFLAEANMAGHHWLEYVSWIANGILAIAAVLALIQVWAALKAAKTSLQQTAILADQLKITSAQLSTSIKDVELRSKREALSMALEQCKRFAESIVPHFDEVHKQMVGLNYVPPTGNLDPEFPWLGPDKDAKGVDIWVNHIDLRMKITHALNELESFAMYFTLDLADEQAAFPPTGQTFCFTCEYYRFFIGAWRPADKIKLYSNLVQLYSKWKPRLEHTAIQEQVKILEKRKQQLPADQISHPIGTKINRA